MNLDIILQFATLSTLVVGIIGILVRINGYRRQLNANLFIEYAGHYDAVIRSFPQNVWAQRFVDEEQLPQESHEITICVFRFLNFLAGAYYFHKKGYIEKEAWHIWEIQINTILQSPLFRREWCKFSSENVISKDFRLYIETIQKG